MSKEMKSGTSVISKYAVIVSPKDNLAVVKKEILPDTKGRGLWLMQGPGYDQESTPGLVGAGATVIVFTTGRGTTIGNETKDIQPRTAN
jgi:altronate dehydratase